MTPPCEITSGHSKQNCPNNGGIDAYVIINHENIDQDSIVLSATEAEVTAMVSILGKKAYTFTPDKESASYTQTPTRSRENNSYMVVMALLMMLKDDVLATQESTMDLGKGFFLIIARQSNGLNRVFGLFNGMTMDTEENVSGQLYEDMNGSTMNFMGKELGKAPLVSDAIVDQLLIPPS